MSELEIPPVKTIEVYNACGLLQRGCVWFADLRNLAGEDN
jgi:hypothetical protein